MKCAKHDHLEKLLKERKEDGKELPTEREEDRKNKIKI